MRRLAMLLLAAASLHALALSQREAFGDAQWIGGDDSQMPLSPATLTVFNLDWTIDGDDDCWLTFGASDPRLADPYKNIWQPSPSRRPFRAKMAKFCHRPHRNLQK